MKTPTVEFYVDHGNSHRWNLKHGNGKTLAASSEGFKSKSNAKRNFKAVRDAMAKVVVTAALLLVVGCSTPQRTAYQSVNTTIIAVDVAMSEWGAYVKVAHPPLAEEQAVKNAYEKYQASMAAVCDAGAIYAGSAQTNATAVSGALQTAILNSSQSIADLEHLIATFGVKLK